MVDESYDVEDFDFNIKELQRIIEESPPGMQARFARIIGALREKRLMLSTIKIKEITHSKEDLYCMILKKVENEIEMASDPAEKFGLLLELTKIRESLTIKKQNKRISKEFK